MNFDPIEIQIKLRDQISTQLAIMRTGFTGLGKVVSGIGSVLGSFQAQLAAIGISLAGGAFLRSSVMTFADFDDKIRAAGAVSRATADEMKLMADEAKKMGATTRYSATQAAEALENLGMAGFSAVNAVAALPKVLTLAAAGSVDLGEAAGIAAKILAGYGLQVKDLAQVNDVLAKTFTSTFTTLSGLGEGFKHIGPIYAAIGGDFEELIATLGKLQGAGLEGGTGGTALKGAVSKLMNPVGDSVEMLENLKQRMGGVALQVKDAEGNFVGFIRIIEQLEAAGLRGDEALRLFGDEAGPGMAALVNVGSKAIKELLDQLRVAQGTADQIAAEKEGGIGGAIRNLESAFEAFKIAIGETFEKDLKKAVDAISQFLVDLAADIDNFRNDGSFEEWKKEVLEILKIVEDAWDNMAFVFTVGGKEIKASLQLMQGDFKGAWKSFEEADEAFFSKFGLGKQQWEDRANAAADEFLYGPKKEEEKSNLEFYKPEQRYKVQYLPSGKEAGEADIAGLKLAEEKMTPTQKPIGKRTTGEDPFGKPVVDPSKTVSKEAEFKAHSENLKADIEYETAAIEILYEQGKKTATEYYAKKEELLRRSFQIEISMLEKSLSTENDLDKKAAINAQIYANKRELETSLLELTADRIKAEQDLEKEKLEMLKQQNQDRLRIEEVHEDIKQRISVGNLGFQEAKFQEEIFQLQERHRKEHQILVDAKAGDEEFVKLTRAQELEELQVHEDQARRILEYRLDMAEQIAGGMSSLFGEMYEMSGKKSKEMFYLSKAAAIAEATIKTSQAIIGALGSPPYGPGAIAMSVVIAAMGGAQIAKIMATGLAEGGRVPGHSPHSKADNIPAWLTADEFVQPVRAVRHYGVATMEAIRTLSIPKENLMSMIPSPRIQNPYGYRYSYAEGGSVRGAPEPSQAASTQQNFDIVNVVDKSVFDQYLGSTTGKKALMNIIRSNAYELKNAMAAEM